MLIEPKIIQANIAAKPIAATIGFLMRIRVVVKAITARIIVAIR